METEFRRDASCSYLVIKSRFCDDSDYAVNMLINNKIPGILETKSRCFNNEREFYYDISSKSAMSKYYSQYKMGEREIRGFVFGLSRVSTSVKEYLLDINCVCMTDDLIFINPDTWVPEFCYYPDLKNNFFDDLRHLLGKLLAVVDYESRQAVEMAYGIQQIIVNENYTIEQILQFINSDTGKDSQKKAEEQILTLSEQYAENEKENQNKKENKKNRRQIKKGLLHFIKNGFIKKESLMTLEQLNNRREMTDKTIDKTDKL